MINQQTYKQNNDNKCKKGSTGSFREKSADSIHQITYQQKSEGSDCGKNLAFRKRREEQSHSQAGTSQQKKTKQCHVSRCKSNASVLCHDQRIETQDHDRKKKSDDQCQVFSKHNLPYRHRCSEKQLVRLLFAFLCKRSHGKDR